MLGENAIVSRLHVINGTTCDDFSDLFDMVLQLDVLVLPAVCAVDRVPENVAVEPFSVVESDVESEFFLSALFSDSHMADFLDLFSVEL